jgi:hypothetical protein
LVPWIVKVVGMAPSPAPDESVVPFMYQIAISPLEGGAAADGRPVHQIDR